MIQHLLSFAQCIYRFLIMFWSSFSFILIHSHSSCPSSKKPHVHVFNILSAIKLRGDKMAVRWSTTSSVILLYIYRFFMFIIHSFIMSCFRSVEVHRPVEGAVVEDRGSLLWSWFSHQRQIVVTKVVGLKRVEENHVGPKSSTTLESSTKLLVGHR